MNGIIGGVLRCQRFYSQPSRVTETSVHNGGIVTSTDIQKLTAIYLEQWDARQSS